MSIMRNIMKFTQHKYKLTDISYLDDIVIPKKSTTREDVKAKRENYLKMNEVKAVVYNLYVIANSIRAGYMKRSFIMTAYIM